MGVEKEREKVLWEYRIDLVCGEYCLGVGVRGEGIIIR